jgi:hypothetical protein
VTPTYNVPLRLLVRMYTAGCLIIATNLDSGLRRKDAIVSLDDWIVSRDDWIVSLDDWIVSRDDWIR